MNLQTMLVVFAAACVWPSWAAAQPDDTESVPRVYPVDGRLQHDAALVDAQVSIRFSTETFDWVEEWSNLETRSCMEADCRLTVVDGRFTAPLGQYASLDDVILQRENFEVTVEVYDEGAGVWQTFDAPIEVHSVPRAYWTTSISRGHYAELFDVGGDLTVESGTTDFDTGLTIDDIFGAGSTAGALTTAGVTVTSGLTEVGGDLEMTGTLSASGLDIDGTLSVGDAGRVFRHDGTVPYLGPDATSVSIESHLIVEEIELTTTGSYIDLNGSLETSHWGIAQDEYLFRTSAGGGWDPDDYGSLDGYNFNSTSAHDWYCWVAGSRTYNVDFCANWTVNCAGSTDGGSCSSDSDCDDSGIGYCHEGSCYYAPMLSAYVFPDYGTDNDYSMVVTVASDNIGASAIALMCANTSIIDFRCSDGDGHLSEDCASEISSGTDLDGSDVHGMVNVGRWPTNWPARLGEPQELGMTTRRNDTMGGLRILARFAPLALALAMIACGGSGDSTTDAPDDAGQDAATDDAAFDAGADVADAGDDTGPDASVDGGEDASDDADADPDAPAPIACVSTNGCQAVAPGTLCIDGFCEPCGSDDACIGDDVFGEGAVCLEGACVICEAGALGCPCDDGLCADGACVVDVCTDCEPGAEGCACTDDGSCDVGFRCTDELVCATCPAGDPGCPCNDGACGDGYACIADLCVTDDCVAGAVGCPCDDGLCDEDLFCDDDSLCMVCDADGIGCPCTIEGGCSNDFICDVESDEDGAPLVCRAEYTCDDDVCGDYQLCADGEDPDGEDAECLEACEDAWEWDAETSGCIEYVGPNCTPGERRSEYETCLAENRECVVEGETASCGECLDFYLDDDGGSCRAVLTCDDLAETCATELRDCTDETATTDAFCGDCTEGALVEGEDCVIPPNTCGEGDYSIADTCSAANRTCEPNVDEGGALDSAACGDCIEEYAETDEGTCDVATFCDDLGCDLLGRSCAGDPFAACGDCEGLLVPSDADDPLSLCRDALTCDDIDCGDDYCFVSETGGDAFCGSTCEDGFAFDAYGTCVECTISCSATTDGATGRIWPVTRDGSDACICETESGWFLDPSRAALPQPCDGDGDGWVRASAAAFIESSDSVIAENARCEVQSVGSFTLQNEWQQTLELHICGTDLVADEDLDSACEEPTPLELYEPDELDDDDAIEALSGFFPTYANNGTGRVLHAAEMNPLTKACVSEVGDHNANDVPDVEEHQTMDAPEAVTFDAAQLVWVQMGYFIELAHGYHQVRPLEDYDTWMIVEAGRCDEADAERPFAPGYASAGTTEYWRQCARTRAASYDASTDTVGTDFQRFSCDATSGACELPSIAVDAANRDGSVLVDYQLCEGADLPPEDGVWRGMNHASQFQCVVLAESVGADAWEFALDEVFDGSTGDWEFNVCGVACTDASCADDCTDGDCASSIEADGAPDQAILACDQDASPEDGDVGFVAARYLDAEDGGYTYERGCIDEWEVWADLCPGYADPTSLPEGSDDVVIGDGLSTDFGRLTCGCGTNYGGDSCEIGCPTAAVTDDYDIGAGWWLCADMSVAYYETLDETYGPGRSSEMGDGETYVVFPQMGVSGFDAEVLCENEDCATGFVMR